MANQPNETAVQKEVQAGPPGERDQSAATPQQNRQIGEQDQQLENSGTALPGVAAVGRRPFAQVGEGRRASDP